MKKNALLVVWALTICQIVSAQQYFYGDNGSLELHADLNSQVIHFEDNISFHTFNRNIPLQWNILKKIEKYNVVVLESRESFPSDLAALPQFSELNIKNQDYILRLDDGFGLWLGYEMLFEPKPGFESEVATLIQQYNGKQFIDQYGMYRAELNNPTATLDISNEMVELGLVNWAHPNFYANHTRHVDPRYVRQFQMHNTGQTIGGVTGVNDIDCDAPEAWAISTGDETIIVAVIDDGVEDHEDMNDANGDSRKLDGNTPANGGDGTPVGTNSHGMACTGIIAASHNDIGVRGAAPLVKILPVDIFQGSETTADLAEAFNWARLQGADVMSNSWGYNSCTLSISALNSAISNATNLGRGGLGSVVVFASGNAYGSCVDYPADLSYVMGVGAVTSLGVISNYSNQGPTLDIVAPSNAAPGQSGAGVSTTDRPGSPGYSSGNYTNNFGGTSAACPLVSGVAALVLSVNPGLTEDEVRTILENSATDMGSSGFDNTFGHGRVNAHDALLLASPAAEECTSTINTIPYQEGFESGINDWIQSTSDELNWNVNSGGTPSSNTGPSSAFEGSQYLHIEASSPNYPSKSGVLISPCFDLSTTTNPELAFAYHMYGTTMGTLNIEVTNDGGESWTSVWTLSGNQGNSWFDSSVSLADYAAEPELKIRITGTTGTSYTGDISIDNMEIVEASDEACDNTISDFPYSEGFESSSFAWNQSTEDNINWTRRTGGTPSSNTGPSSASEASYYMYIEASSPNYPSKNAFLDSDCFDLSSLSEASISFDYHMYGSTMGTLLVQAKIGNGSWTNLWTINGDQGNSWKFAEINLADYVGNDEVVLRFNGTTGTSYRSDIAIDNIQITAGSSDIEDCPTLSFTGISVNAYGGSQDNGTSEIAENGDRLNISNNAWKSIDFSYSVTANTILAFEFKSSQEGEIHGIGFDTDANISSQYTFKVHGTQNWGILNYDTYSGSDWVTYTINVGNSYMGTFNKLFFVGDNDNGPAGDNSSFRNIAIYESGDCNISASSNDLSIETPVYGQDSEREISTIVFPNPTTGEITVFMSELENAEISILNLTGKVLLKEQLLSNNQKISLETLANGIYMVQIKNGDTLVDIQKIVKSE